MPKSNDAMHADEMRTTLPAGCRIRRLEPHADERGVFIEIFREAWQENAAPVQWNAVHSRAGVLRGVHVHPTHDDYLLLTHGRATIGLRDLRRGSRTEGLATTVDLDGEAPSALTIPHGVAHGFFFHEPSLHVYAVSHYWNDDDERRCHWQDPALEIPWPTREATLSRADMGAPPLRVLLTRLASEHPGVFSAPGLVRA